MPENGPDDRVMGPDRVKLRPEVQWFAERMEVKVRSNDWKGCWQNMTPTEILARIREDTDELEDVLRGGAVNVMLEAVDVANFAMMLADVVWADEAGCGTSARDTRTEDR